MAQDYYDILGISKTASQEEIDKAFRKLSRKFHPDRNPGDAAAESKFKDIQKAHTTLSDPQKRAIYDQYGEVGPGFMPGAGGSAGSHPFFTQGGGGDGQIPPEMAEELFRMFGGGGGGTAAPEDLFSAFGGGKSRTKGRQRRAAPSAIEVEAHVPFLTAATGGTLALAVGTRKIDLKVPAGFEHGKKLRLAGQGGNGEDILVRILIDPHPYFKREGKDILLEVPISVGEAILGGKVEVPTISGKRIDVKIKPGTSGGSRLRIPGFGIAGGDQYLLFKVLVPKTEPDPASRELIEQYVQANPLNARVDIPWASS
ncbi:MAG: J domain-containing protein [Zavarzinella sp.]